MKYFIYRRKSEEDEDRQMMSFEGQQDEITRLIATHPEIVIVEDIKEAKSAKAPGRVLFNSMMERIEQGEADGIIAWHPDRLARNSVDGGRIIHDIDTGKLKDLKFCSYTFENNPQGKFMLSMIFAQSKYYVDALSVNVKRGIQTKLKHGWRPNLAPLGYFNCKDTSTIKLDKKHAKVVRKIFDLKLLHKKSVSEIHRIIADKDGYITPLRKSRGGKRPCRSMIYRILTNPFYTGYILWNGQLHDGKHTPIISKSEFERTQQLLGLAVSPRPKRLSHAYGGIFKCGACGLSVTAEHKRKPSGKSYTYYHCTRVHRTPHCTQPTLEERVLEGQVIDFLDGIFIPEIEIDWLANILKENTLEINEAKQEQDEDFKIQKKSLEQQLSNLTDLRLRDILDDDEFSKRRKIIIIKIAVIAEQRQELQQTALTLEPLQILSLPLYRAKYWHHELNHEQKKRMLEILCSNPLLKDKKALLVAKKQFQQVTDLANLSIMRRERLKVGTATESAKRFNNRLMKKMKALCVDPEVKKLSHEVKTFIQNVDPELLEKDIFEHWES